MTQLSRRTVMAMGMAGALGGLAGCGPSAPDYATLQQQLHDRLAALPGVTVQQVKWTAPQQAQSQSLLVVLAVGSSDQAATTATRVMKEVSVQLRQVSGDGLFYLQVLDPAGGVLLRQDSITPPARTFAEIRTAYP